MKFKNERDNKYRVNFMRATEALLDDMTVDDFIEYLENNAELEDDSQSEYIDGKVLRCRAYELKETDKLHKEFLVTEDGRVFYWVSLMEKAELIDNIKKWEETEVSVAMPNKLWSTLVCYILMTTQYRTGELKAWQELAEEKEENGEPKFKNAAGNAEFWQQIERELEEIKKRVDER